MWVKVYARALNVALLGKQALNLFNANNKMWVKIYGHKYPCNNNLFTATILLILLSCGGLLLNLLLSWEKASFIS